MGRAEIIKYIFEDYAIGNYSLVDLRENTVLFFKSRTIKS
jgi:hypothetical protein